MIIDSRLKLGIVDGIGWRKPRKCKRFEFIAVAIILVAVVLGGIADAVRLAQTS